MKFIKSLLLFSIMIVALSSVGQKKSEEVIVLIETSFGDLKAKLYNETPIHRDNFLKLVEEGFYDDLLFHRVIKDFMIQGGDPESKEARAEKNLGNGGPGYTLTAEISNSFIHKKGALSAARLGDNVNPEKKSSGSQFYIVQGKPIAIQNLNQVLKQKKAQAMQGLYNAYLNKPENKNILDTVILCQQQGDKQRLKQVINSIKPKLEEEYEKNAFDYSDEQKEMYANIGGTPHLDGGYTVFGEVIEGLEIIDKIAAVNTNAGDRPIEDVIMNISIISKPKKL